MPSRSVATRKKGSAPEKGRVSRPSVSRRSATKKTTGKISGRTEKQIAKLPEHAKKIYKEAHGNALAEYRDPSKRRGGKKQSVEEVAHKVAWAAVKNVYQKQGDEWVRKG